jgi:trehalose 6-phosphate phosphatase
MDRDALTAALAADPARAALVLDFDGVLARIGDDPAASALEPGTAAVLAELAQHLGVVAVLSGRPLAFLRQRVDVRGVALHGSYGVQWREGDEDRVLEEVGRWQPAVDTAAGALRAAFGDTDGVHVEDKGIAVAVHWRRAPEQEQAVAAVVAELVAGTGLRAEPGKLVVELRPPLEQDKGTALRRIAAGLGTVVYAGDDRGDLPALRVARELGGHAVVVEHGRETAPELLEVAEVVLQGTDEVTLWLTGLRDALTAGTGPGEAMMQP